MSRKTSSRLVRAVTDRLWQRDRLQMRVAGALLSAVEGPRTRARRGASTQSKRWNGFRSVLCPIDFSENSRRALCYAAAIARRDRALLTVAHVNDPLLSAAATLVLHDRGLPGRSAASELRTFVHATLSPAGARHVRVKYSVVTGQPAEQILRLSTRIHPDLVVIGTNGLTTAKRLFTGSTTLATLQRSMVSVLVIPCSNQPELPWRCVEPARTRAAP